MLPVNPSVDAPLYVFSALCCAVLYFQITAPTQDDRDRSLVTPWWHAKRVAVALMCGALWPGFLFVVTLYTIPPARRLLDWYVSWGKPHRRKNEKAPDA